MPKYKTEAEEARDRYCPDIIIGRGNYRQIRIHHFAAGRIELRTWYSHGDGVWRTDGVGLKMKLRELEELIGVLPAAIEAKRERYRHVGTDEPTEPTERACDRAGFFLACAGRASEA